MQISGTITQVLPIQQGLSQQGKPWSKQQYILETDERYPKTIAFVLMGDNIAKFGVQQGQKVTVDFDVESHEYQGKWYHSITGWRVTQSK